MAIAAASNKRILAVGDNVRRDQGVVPVLLDTDFPIRLADSLCTLESPVDSEACADIHTDKVAGDAAAERARLGAVLGMDYVEVN